MKTYLLPAAFVASGALWLVPAQACTDHGAMPVTTVRKGASAQSGKTTRSGETTAERAARLKRECKGLPNAGACLGYAS